MNQIPLYPLRFEPICQYRLWGGRRLSDMMRTPLPGDGPVGEAWILSDRDDFPSLVAEGPLKGYTIQQLLEQSPIQLLGNLAGCFRRFPLLLKFLDAREMLSVQVHPSDLQSDYLLPGEPGKTEAWVVLEAEGESRVYAGLKPGTNASDLRLALASRMLANHLASFAPNPGDCVFLRAGTVHALGGGLVVFEVQQNSDVTFRLYDWDRVDAKTGLPRDLQVDQAIACLDFIQGAVGAVEPVVETEYPVLRERLLDCDHFRLWRLGSEKPFVVGAPALPRVLVCIAGKGQLDFHRVSYDVVKGDVFLLPAVVGACLFRPRGEVSLLEVSLPEGTQPGVTQTKDFQSQPILEIAADVGATERTVE